VSHILFTVPADATPEQKAKIKAQAEKILAEVKANPSKFASLAKEYSQDPGSAANGGDLGFFGRGVMVKPFESAAFALHQGEISNLVETQYGFHILKMNAFKGGDEASKRQLAREQVQKQKAQQQLSSVVDQLNDITYNKSDSLEPAAKQLGLTLQTTPNWVSKTTAQDVFANPKVQKVMFSADVVKQHHNSEVIDLGDGSYVVLRALDYQASLQKPLATIKAQVIEIMKSQQASQMAALQGQQQLAQLQQGKLKLNFTNAESVTLLGGNKAIDQAAVKQIFAVAAESFPSYTGSPTQDGKFVIYQINSQRVDKSLLEQNQKLLQQMSDQYAMISLNAYLSALQSKYKISYRADRLANNNAQGAGSN
jgi:peptidyl-prolyl cis-trans isomerase D